ncbi:MAG: S8 family serine peptidase [Candidatus Dormibacteraceae bacterium]
MLDRLKRVAARFATPLLLSGALIVGPGAPVAQAGSESTYIVVYGSAALPAGSTQTIQSAGGRMVVAYPEIGVSIARSTNASFSRQVKTDSNVSSVTSTKAFATHLKTDRAESTASDTAAESGDFASLTARQWDMTQIKAFAAQEITKGSRKVLVGDIDTGLDYTHPNLKANVDFKNSVSCIGGVTNTAPSAWMDDDGHGTHTAGTIAAGGMEGGILGVAPNIRIAGIKAGDANGYFYPEAVVCAFMWAGRHHMDVTNNSYFADPWLYNCLADPGQRAIYEAETRAMNFAMGKGVTIVAAAGNEIDDIGNPTVDNISPDDGTPIVGRDVSKNCFVVPSMVQGVYTVSSVGNRNLKSFYSSYGMPWVQATAPGGDSIYFDKSANVPNGRVLSTYPASLFDAFASTHAARRSVKICDENGQCATYVYHQGTSMASPHVAGVAALIASRFGHQDPETMTQLLNAATNQLPCPPDPFLPTWTGPNGTPAHCTGTLAYNSFYGHGQIDALKAVTGETGESDSNKR